VYQVGLPSQSRATSTAAATTSTSAAPPTAYIPYQPRIGAYPYAVGTWGYHYPSIPTATTSSSVPPLAAQGDSGTKLVTSGTFAYPYQYTPGQPEYVSPQIKYPYGAPALSVPTPSPSSPSAGVTSTTSAVQERQYNGMQWKESYIVGSRDPNPAAETQAQESSTEVWESTSNPSKVALITDTDNVPPSAANSVPTSMEIAV
jgi:hypothetical protein